MSNGANAGEPQQPYDFVGYVHEPSQQLAHEFDTEIVAQWRARQEPLLYREFVLGQLRAATQTYRATILLLDGGDDRHSSYPLQAAILNRSVLECVANVACLAEDPVERSRRFALDDVRARFEALAAHGKHFANVPGSSEMTAAEEDGLRAICQELGIPFDPRRPPNVRWPRIGSMLRSTNPTLLTGSRRAIVHELNAVLYPAASRRAHSTGDAIGMAICVHHEHSSEQRQAARYDLHTQEQLYIAALMLTCVLSEVHDAMGLSNAFIPRVGRLWGHLIAVQPHLAGRIYAIRYSAWILLPDGPGRPPFNPP